jgi:hypothetical protein
MIGTDLSGSLSEEPPRRLSGIYILDADLRNVYCTWNRASSDFLNYPVSRQLAGAPTLGLLTRAFCLGLGGGGCELVTCA